MSSSEGSHLSLNVDSRHAQAALLTSISKQSESQVQSRPKVLAFEYTPLPTTSSIRLVRLRGQDPGTGLLQCSLETVELKERPSYDIVSSQCGFSLPAELHHSYASNSNVPYLGDLSPHDKFEPCVPVICNGRVLKITRSIYKLLRRMQRARGFDKRYHQYNKTALIRTAEQGREGPVGVLINKGAALDCQDCFGNTAIHYAAENGHLKVVRMLVTAGARTDLYTYDHRTPLTCAENAKHEDVIEYLSTLDDQQESIAKSHPGNIEPSDQLFWVDAICVDHTNVRERQSLENVLSQLYECAQTAIVWLGDSDKSTALAKGALASLASLFYIPPIPEEEFAVCVGDRSIFAQRNCPDFRIAEWHALVHLLRRPWFKGFTVQKNLLAQTFHTLVYCGTEEFLWDEIVHVADYFERRHAVMLLRSKHSDEHFAISCNHCSKGGDRDIRGIRYKCAVCMDIDFCAPCLADETNRHNPDHEMIKIEQSRTHVGIPVMEHSFETRIPWPFLRRQMRSFLGYTVFAKLPTSTSSEPSIPTLSPSIRSKTLRLYEPYAYAKLPSSTPTSTWFRLLKLRGYDSGGLMNVSMEAVKLESKPVYMAASYTWGNPMPEGSPLVAAYNDEQPYPVLCDDQALFIDKNLHDFLCELMKPHKLEPRDSRFDATPLHWAALRGHLKTVRFHIQTGADVHSRNNQQSTPLHLAALAGDQADVVNLLLENGADVTTLDVGQNTPLHWAARGGYLEVTKLLVDARSDIAVHNSVGKSPLAIAQEYHPDTVGRFLEDLPVDHGYTRAINRKRPVPRITEMSYWIDAICINQNDDVEKASQINIMSEIYGSASGTSVWFGLPDASTETALEAISLMGSQKMRYREAMIQWGATSVLNGAVQLPEEIIQKATAEQGITASHFEALHTFLRRQWFSRVWILQEVSLANYVEMLCGPYQLLWRELFLVLEDMAPSLVLFTNGFPLKYVRASKGAAPWVLSMLRLRTHPNLYHHPTEVAKRWPSWQAKLPLAVLIILSWNFSASNPRDRIFALLGLAQELPDDQRVVVDYKVPIETLYTATAKIMYHGSHDVDGMDNSYAQHLEDLKESEVLSIVQDSSLRTTPNLPSWVPEFNLRIQSTRIWMSTLYSCGGTVKNPMQSTVSASHLGLSCMHWDTVTLVEHASYSYTESLELDTDDEPRFVKFPLYQWLLFIAEFDQTYITGQDRMEVLWRTLMLDRNIPSWLQDTHDSLVTPAQPKDSMKSSFFGTVRGFLSENPYPNTDLSAFHDSLAASDTSGSLPSTKDVEAWLQSDAVVARRVAQRTAGPAILSRFLPFTPSPAPAGEQDWAIWFRLAYIRRRLFRTGKGYLGLGPQSMRKGDHVCILPGACVPFIFRKATVGENCHQLVGEAYVHGIMQGEAMQSGEAQFKSVILI